MKFAVCVTFRIAAEHWDAFLKLMHDNAQASLNLEVDCLQFDVCTDPARPNEVFLYEIYTSPEAFEQHLQSAHFRVFNSETSEMIEDKQVTTYSVVK